MNVGHPQGRVCMRDLIVTENITLDGVVEATDNWLPGRDIVVTGSIALAHALIAADWSTNSGCSSTRSSWVVAGGCSRTAPA